jgi:hypothetical protein
MALSEFTNCNCERDCEKGGVTLKDASTDSACKIFRYEIREDEDGLRIRAKLEGKNGVIFSEEAFAAFSKDTDIYCDWLKTLVDD